MTLRQLAVAASFIKKAQEKASLRNASWLTLEKLLRVAIIVPIEIFVARYLGPEKYGALNYAFAFVGIFLPLAALGLRQITIRNLVWEPENHPSIMGAAFSLHFVGSLVSVFLALLIILIIRPNDQIVHILVIIVSLRNIVLAFDVIEYLYQSRNWFGYVTVARTSALFISASLKGILILVGARIEFFAIAFTLEFSLAALVLLVLYYYTDKQHPLNWRTSRQRVTLLLRESGPLAISSFAIMLQAYVDQIMLGTMMTDFEVGQYSVAIKLIGYISFVPGIIVMSLAPSIAATKKQNESIYQVKLGRLYEYMFGLFVILGIPTFFFARLLVPILYGVEYTQAGALLSLLAIRLLFANFGLARSLFIINDKLFNLALATSLLGALINILGNYLLIPVYGAFGAIIASIISFTVTIFIVDAVYLKSRGNFMLMITTPHRLWVRYI